MSWGLTFESPLDRATLSVAPCCYASPKKHSFGRAEGKNVTLKWRFSTSATMTREFECASGVMRRKVPPKP